MILIRGFMLKNPQLIPYCVFLQICVYENGLDTVKNNVRAGKLFLLVVNEMRVAT